MKIENENRLRELIIEFRSRINNLSHAYDFVSLKTEFLTLYDWFESRSEFSQHLSNLYTLWHIQKIIKHNSFLLKSTQAYGAIEWEVWDMFINGGDSTDVNLKKLKRSEIITLNRFKDMTILSLFQISDYLYELLVSKNEEFKNIIDGAVAYNKYSKFLMNKMSFKFKNHKLICGKSGMYGSITFSPNKSIHTNQSIVESLIKLAVDNDFKPISFSQIKIKIPSFVINDFYSYKTYLGKLFDRETNKGNLKFNMLITTNLSIKGDPKMQFSPFKF